MQKCLECGHKFHGRADKKYCSDQCRTSFHNKQNSDENNYMRNVNNILRKNRRILLQHNPHGKAKIQKNALLEKGFKFNYFTNEYITQTGKKYKFCYEQGYIELDEQKLALVHKQEYVE